MWAEFCLASLVGAVLLYVPGYVFFRAIRLSSFASFACAPVFAVVAYCMLGIVFFNTGIRSTAAYVAACATVLSFIAYGIASLVGRRTRMTRASRAPGEARFDALCVALYVLVGVAVAAFAFVLPLDGPDSSVQTYDNVHHFALVQSFAESGDWSALNTSAYLSVSGDHANPLPGTAYYPAGWHLLCAMLVDALGIEVSLAVNAINFLLVAAVFPAGMALLMRILFPSNRAVALLGALCPLALGAFPWVLVEVWPLYPNAASLALLPPLMACFVAACRRDASRSERGRFVAAFAIGIVCMAFMQPNSVFAAAVFLIPYCVYRVGCETSRRLTGARHRRLFVLAFGALSVVAITVAWVLSCSLPFFQGVVGYYWPPIASKTQGLLSVVGLAFAGSAVQPVAAVLVVVGAAYTIRHRRYLWLSFSYALMCCIYYISAVEGDTWLKHIASGFWYTDPYRTAACAAVFALPLLALGLYGAYAALGKTLARIGLSSRSASAAVPAVVVATVFVVFNFLPIRTALGAGQDAFAGIVSTAASFNDGTFMDVFDEDERRFVEQVEEIVPEDALIVNQPYDGSLFAYSLDGLNLYYRDMSGYGGEDETPESAIIRTGLSDWASDTKARDALRLTGAEYVLILERDSERAKEFFFLYNQDDWAGIEAVDDDTPGFETVLKDGDMRLYRIASDDALQ